MIYLQFAGVNIALNFIPSGEPDFFEEPLFFSIKNAFGAYFVDKCPVYHTVNFYKADNYEYFFNLKEKKDYVLVSRRVSSRQTDSFYHISMPQLQIILRNICQSAIAGKGAILHASSVVGSGKGYIFLGDSGAGKSTIARNLKPNMLPFTDDSIIIKKEKNEWVMFQSPVLQKNNQIVRNSKPVKIAKFCFLHKSVNNRVTKILNKESVLTGFIKQLYSDRESLNKQVALMMNLVSNNDNFFDVYFNLQDFKKLGLILESDY